MQRMRCQLLQAEATATAKALSLCRTKDACLRDSVSSAIAASEPERTQMAALAMLRTQLTVWSEVPGRSEQGNDLRCCLKGSARSYKKSGLCRSKNKSILLRNLRPREESPTAAVHAQL